MLILSKDWTRSVGREAPRRVTMRYVILIVMVLFAQNVFAQDDPPAEPAADQAPSDPDTSSEPPVDPRTQQCLDEGGGEACCNGLAACVNAQAELGRERRAEMAAYGESPEQRGRNLCRGIGGSWGDLWDGSDWRANCECLGSRQWDANHEFCVPPNADYLERLCTESGGRWTGGRCDCRGRQLDGGRCTGLNRIDELEQDLAEAEGQARDLGEALEAANTDLTAARANGASQAEQLAALERQRDALQARLDQALQDIAYLRGRLEAEDIEVPADEIPSTVATQPPGTAEPIPGAAAAAAEVAMESTEPPVGQAPTVEEEEEGWPEWAKWLLGIGIAGGVAAGTLIPLCEAGIICGTSIVQ